MVTFSDAAKVTIDAFVTPVWVVDAERADLIWANRSALTLFAAATLEELLGREHVSGANAFLVAELSRLVPGGRLESEFRVLQSGFELLVTCSFTGIESEPGRKLVLVEAH